MPSLTIYSRPGCHLCEVMKDVVVRVARKMPLVVEEVDITGDPALEALYGTEIPVLLVEGRKAAKYRISDEELVAILKGRMGGTDR